MEWYEEAEDSHAPHIELLDTTAAQELPSRSEPFRPRHGLVPVVVPGPVSQEGCCQFTCEFLKHVMYQRLQLPLPYEQLKHFYRQSSPQVGTAFRESWWGGFMAVPWEEGSEGLRNLQDVSASAAGRNVFHPVVSAPSIV